MPTLYSHEASDPEIKMEEWNVQKSGCAMYTISYRPGLPHDSIRSQKAHIWLHTRLSSLAYIKIWLQIFYALI